MRYFQIFYTLTLICSCTLLANEELAGCACEKKETVQASASETYDRQGDLDYLNFLDEEITRLSDERDKYTARAARMREKGNRLQFQSGYIQEAKRHWDAADNSDEIAKQLQEVIDQLKDEKKGVLEKLQGQSISD